jgi:hypothetical protein
LSVNTGDPVSGFFLVDTNLNDVDPDPAHAQYRHFFMAGVTIFINGSRLEISDYIVKVSDDYIGTMADLFEVQNFGVVTLDGVPIFLTAGELDFTGDPVDTFSGFAVPDPSIITNWPGNVDLGLMGDTSLHHVTFSINTVRLASPIDIDIKSAIVWTGLKNSDDQGTRFDLRAALYINDALVAEGQTLCVTGITRNPSNAKEVMVPFGPISTNELASGDVVSLKVFTRIGSNPDGSKCPGHSNAVGLRLYYDSPTRPSGFGAEISPAPMTDYFLHSGGGDYFLDKVSPTGPVKYKDSSGVNYKNGNPWKEIGTWSMTLP